MKRNILKVIPFIICFCILPFSVYPSDMESQEILRERHRKNKLSRSTPSIARLSIRSDIVYQLQTAVGFVTTIDLPEPALKVFVGDQDLFKVEVYDKNVIVKPVTDWKEAKSNLTIFTEHGRLTFNIIVGPPETVDFVLDFRLPRDESMVENAMTKAIEDVKGQLQEDYQKKEEDLVRKTDSLGRKKIENSINNGLDFKKLKISKSKKGIKVILRSLVQVRKSKYLKFSICNNRDNPFYPRLMTLLVKSRCSGRDTYINIPCKMHLPDVIKAHSCINGLAAFNSWLPEKGDKVVLYLYGNKGFMLKKEFKWK